MNERSYWREWPLAVFTIALQFASALACLAAVSELRSNRMIAGDLADIIVPALVVAISVSLLHVGRPHAAWRALMNLRRSRLSQEVWAVGMFLVSAVIYDATTYGSGAVLPVIFGSITAALGIVAVIANARVYRIAAEPGWRTAWAVVSLAGIAAIAAVLLPLLHSR